MRLTSAVLFTALVACDPLEPCERTALVDNPGLELGIGDPDGFSGPVTEGQEVLPSFGSQGGQHLYLSVRSHGLWPGDRNVLGEDDEVPLFHAELTDGVTGEVVALQDWQFRAMNGDEFEADLALEEFFLPGPIAYDTTSYESDPSVDTPPQEVLLKVTAVDDCGTKLEPEVGFTIVW
jgi:hypothetical protein